MKERGLLVERDVNGVKKMSLRPEFIKQMKEVKILREEI